MLLNAIKRSGILAPWIVATFFAGGLITNVIQILLFVIVQPIHKQLYRILLHKVVYSSFCVVTFLAGWWAQVELIIYASKEDFQKVGEESAIVISNHRGAVDWLSAWLFADASGVLGGCKCFVKDKVKFFPTLGWTWWFAEYVFLKRNWLSDKRHLLDTLNGLKDFPRHFWLGIFPEGTRLTREKLKASQEYAIANGLSPPRHHLLPRPKGFVATVDVLHDSVPAVYDLTIHCDNEEKGNVLALLMGVSSRCHCYLRRYDTKDLPTGSQEELAQWCKLRFKEKDDHIDYYLNNHKFPGEQNVIKPTWGSLIGFLFWSCVLATMLFSFVRWIVLSGSFVVYCSAAVIFLLLLLLLAKMSDLADVQKGSSYGLTKTSGDKAFSPVIKSTEEKKGD